LLWEIPSPDLVKMVRKYLPLFTSRRTTSGADVVPKAIWKKLEDAVKLRNKIVHAREPPPSEEELASLLAAINDFLYTLDWLAGHEWGFNRIREEIRAEWDIRELLSSEERYAAAAAAFFGSSSRRNCPV